jgi:TM2 domain-containing membrane protein YozV
MANPILALIISFFLPGIGTVYAGNIMKGIIIFIML